MSSFTVRFGLAEFATLFLLVAVALLLAAALRIGGLWTIALVPALTYVIAIVAAYSLYRRSVTERAAVSEVAAEAATFRVVDVRGACPLGRQTGDVVTVGRAGTVAPGLCAPAEAVLRLAAAINGEQSVEQWCCPIVEHQLLFERQLAAA